MSKFTKYIVFTFVVSWIIELVGANDLKNENIAGMMSFSYAVSASMFIPAIGALIAKADFRKMGWLPKFDQNWKLILLAWVTPTLFQIAGSFCYYAVFPEELDLSGEFMKEIKPSAYKQIEESGSSLIGFVLKENFFSMTSFNFFIAVFMGLGEEIGWRGFMFPELVSGLGRTKGVLIGGIIHGVWHFPLICLVGYEYGTKYVGAPFLGPVAFCVFTVSTGIISYHLYEKSKCIWLPAIFHGAENSIFGIDYFGASKLHTIFGPCNVGLVSVFPMAVCAALILFFDVKRDSMEFETLDED
ncbi:MAG: CPBP family intramembrane metalloprotease [Ruminococcus sp.]|nr:CPBP family intramembrane metalloprotease [Ruminococcus sp.]